MLRRSIRLFAIVFALSTQSLLAQSAPKTWTADKVQKILQQRVDSPNLSVALAWHNLANKGGEVVWHNGQTGGYHSFIGFDNKRGVGVIVLANTAADIDDIGLHLLDRQIPLRVLEPKKVRTAIKIDPKSLEGYVGDY